MRCGVFALQSPLDVAVAVSHDLLLAPLEVSIIARFGVLIQALLHSSCSVQGFSSWSSFLETKLEVVLSELGHVRDRRVLVPKVFGGDRILVLATVIPELVVTAHIDILVALVEDVGLAG